MLLGLQDLLLAQNNPLTWALLQVGRLVWTVVLTRFLQPRFQGRTQSGSGGENQTSGCLTDWDQCGGPDWTREEVLTGPVWRS